MTSFQLALIILGAIASTIPVVLTQLKLLLSKWSVWTTKVIPEAQSFLLQVLAFGLGIGGVFVAVNSRLLTLPESDTPPLYLYLFLGAACAYGGEVLRLIATFLYTRSVPPMNGTQSAVSADPSKRRGYLPWL